MHLAKTQVCPVMCRFPRFVVITIHQRYRQTQTDEQVDGRTVAVTKSAMDVIHFYPRTRPYASAALAMGRCVCVCVCVSGCVCHKPVLCRTLERTELFFFANRLPSTYPRLRWKKIRVSPTNMANTSLWNCSQTREIEKKFAVSRRPSQVLSTADCRMFIILSVHLCVLVISQQIKE